MLRTFLSVFVLATALVASQVGTSFRGKVSAGRFPVPGAIVTISNHDFVKSVTTDSGGRFKFESVPPGRYDFRTSVPGYAVHESSVIVHSYDLRRNSISVNERVPADRQTVSVNDLTGRN